MTGTMDEGKGRAKRALGEALDDDGLKREGTVDKLAGKAKSAIDDVKDKLQEKMHRD